MTLQLRSLLRPPADAAYWDGLEERIMDRVRADGASGVAEPDRDAAALQRLVGWWEPFAQWTRVGAAGGGRGAGLDGVEPLGDLGDR